MGFSKSPKTNVVSNSPRSVSALTSEESGSARRCKESCRRKGKPPAPRLRWRKRKEEEEDNDDDDDWNPDSVMATIGSGPIRLLSRFSLRIRLGKMIFRFSMTSS